MNRRFASRRHPPLASSMSVNDLGVLSEANRRSAAQTPARSATKPGVLCPQHATDRSPSPASDLSTSANFSSLPHSYPPTLLYSVSTRNGAASNLSFFLSNISTSTSVSKWAAINNASGQSIASCLVSKPTDTGVVAVGKQAQV